MLHPAHSKLLSHPSYKLKFAASRLILSPNFLRLIFDLLQQLEVRIVTVAVAAPGRDQQGGRRGILTINAHRFQEK